MLATSKDTRRIVILSLFLGIITAMSFVPYTGYISYGLISITTLHVPVLIAIIMLGTRDGFIVATAFGLLSMLRAYTSGTIEAVIFMNPLISVAPRMLMGICTGFAAAYLREKISNRYVFFIVVALLGTLLNTVFVLGAIALFAGDSIIPLGDTLRLIFSIIISVNGMLEIGMAVIIVPPICRALTKAGVGASQM
ncbi:MAG: ECF transporter S component [Defluviitaleaceae bacterium]|nr:ECF transporter S component [Defluviitaleaceae bacterium]